MWRSLGSGGGGRKGGGGSLLFLRASLSFSRVFGTCSVRVGMSCFGVIPVFFFFPVICF